MFDDFWEVAGFLVFIGGVGYFVLQYVHGIERRIKKRIDDLAYHLDLVHDRWRDYEDDNYYTTKERANLLRRNKREEKFGSEN